MAEDNHDLWNRLPGRNINKKTLKKRIRKAEGVTVRHTHKFLVKRWDSVREVQRSVILWVLAFGFLIAATGLQLMWNQRNYTTSTAAKNGTYAEATLGTIETLNPLYAKSNTEVAASRLMFSSLMRYDTTGHINYDLASNVKIDDTKMVYTVSLRRDVKWHDGVNLKAKDVNYTVDLMKNPDARTSESGWSNINTRVLDDYTIEFTLGSPFAPFSQALTFPVVPEHILGKIAPNNIRESDFSKNPIGSGPFKFSFMQDVDANSGRKVIYMARNDSYYRNRASLARFQLHSYSKEDDMINALSKNEVTAAAGILFTDINKVNKKYYKTIIKPVQSGMYAIMNTHSSLLTDVKVREALRSATDTGAIIKSLPSGTPSLWLPITSSLLGGNLPSQPQYNLNRAKQLLDSDGWKLNSKNIREKDGKELRLSAVTLKNTDYEHIMEILINQWRSLGVAVDAKIIDPNDPTSGEIQGVLQPRNYDVLLYELSIGGDPDVFAYWHSSQANSPGLNFANYSNNISDLALSSARGTLDTNVRNAKYSVFVKQWLQDVPAIGLYQPTFRYVISLKAHAFDPANVLVAPSDRYIDVVNWSVGTRDVFKTP
jgi:peptide/nickel transport system substrate-binding protein